MAEFNPIREVIASADQFHQLNFESVSEGKKTTRLPLGAESKYYVAINTFNQWNPIGHIYAFFAKSIDKVVEIKDKNQIILINVNSLSSRLLLNKDQLIGKSKDEIWDLLSARAQELGQLSEFTNEIRNALCESTRTKDFVNIKIDGSDLRVKCDESNLEELKKLEKRRDVFALGVVIYYALEKEYPYFTQGDFFDEPAMYENITNPDVPRELDKLLEKMLNFDYTKRPSGTEAWNEFTKILGKYPAIKMKIEGDMRKLGYTI